MSVYYIVVNNSGMTVSLEKARRKRVGLFIKDLRIWIPMGERFDRSGNERRNARAEETEPVGRGISTAATS